MKNRIRDIARDLDAKRIKRFVADNKSLWNLEYHADKMIKTCQEIQNEWQQPRRFYE